MVSRRLLAVLLLGASVASAQLPAGSYSINPAGGGFPNFTSWSAAVTALSAGVTGPGNLDFQVASVTFNESVLIPPIAGTSAATQINFVAAGSPAVIDATGFPIPSDGLILQNTQSYLNFENIHIQGYSRYGLHLFGTSALYSTFCTFKRITSDAPPSTSSTVNAIRNEYSRDCSFTDCTFMGGGYTAYSQQTQRNNYRRCRFDGKSVALRLLTPYNTNDADNLWENCFFHDCGPSGIGLNIDLSSYGNMFFHNTVIVSTTSKAVHLGGCCAWSRANLFRYNVVINHGTGPCITYGAPTPTAPNTHGILEYNDARNNIYWTTNPGNAGVIEYERALVGSFQRGTLAAWQAWFALAPTYTPNPIPAGAGAPPVGSESWDSDPLNPSFEVDPLLLNATAGSYDIHLGPGSPCLNQGTPNAYVPGPWISYNAAYVTSGDFEGDARPTSNNVSNNLDIGADEYEATCKGSGALQPGTTVTLALRATVDATLTYATGTALGGGPIPIDTRFIPLSPDTILLVSVSGALPTVFQNYSNFLNGTGQGTAYLNLPAVPALVGYVIHTAFVTVSVGAPSNIGSVSTPFVFTVLP